MKRVFVAGGTGYIGSATVDATIAAGLVPVVLTRSEEKARALRDRGVEVVRGDLGNVDAWSASLACDAAVFVAAPPTWGKRVSKSVATEFERGLVAMTKSFFAALRGKSVDKIVYVAGTSYYGDAGDQAPRSENDANPPKGWGPYLIPAVDVVVDEMKRGAPVVLAFPGQVYGPASWLEQLLLKPIAGGAKVTGLKGYDPFFSPIHVDDCARALVHLLAHGQAGERYIVVDDTPIRFSTFANEVARLLAKPLQTRRVPRWLCELIIGPVLTEYATAHTNFSNAKLRATGFSPRYATFKEGLPDVVDRWRRR